MLGGLRSTASTTWADSHMLADMSTGFKRIGRRDASDGNLDPRTDKANETFKRLFKMMDYNRDHSLRDAELKAGLQVLEHAWGAFSELCKRTPPPSSVSAASSASSVAFHVLLSRGPTSALSEEAPCAACSQIRATRRTS